MKLLPMQRCPKFEACNAPICPLDPDWRKRTHLGGDALCFYAGEYVKEGGQERVGKALSDVPGQDMLPELTLFLTEVSDPLSVVPKQGGGAIRRSLAKAVKYGSRLEGGKRLRASQQPKP
jgi:hypothetical protein